MQRYKWDNTCPGCRILGGRATEQQRGRRIRCDSVGKAQVDGRSLEGTFASHWRADWKNEQTNEPTTEWLTHWLTFELQAVKAEGRGRAGGLRPGQERGGGYGNSTNSQHKLNKMTRLELAAKHERIQVSRASRTRPRNGKNYRLTGKKNHWQEKMGWGGDTRKKRRPSREIKR